MGTSRLIRALPIMGPPPIILPVSSGRPPHSSINCWNGVPSRAKRFEGCFTLAEYRDRLGTSRKYAAEFLPAMDKAGITVFDGETRRVVK